MQKLSKSNILLEHHLIKYMPSSEKERLNLESHGFPNITSMEMIQRFIVFLLPFLIFFSLFQLLRWNYGRWDGQHVTKVGDKNANKILVEEPKGKMPFRRHRNRLKDNIKMMSEGYQLGSNLSMGTGGGLMWTWYWKGLGILIVVYTISFSKTLPPGLLYLPSISYTVINLSNQASQECTSIQCVLRN